MDPFHPKNTTGKKGTLTMLNAHFELPERPLPLRRWNGILRSRSG